MSFRAGQAGQLPDDGDPIVGGLRLPRGYRVGPADGPHVMWVTNRTVYEIQDLWSQLASKFGETGLWPLVLTPLHGQPKRPWDSGEFWPSTVVGLDELDARDLLSELWSRLANGAIELDETEALLGPYGTHYPGLAPATPGPDDLSALGAVAGDRAGRLGLVAATRPADALAVIGWRGSVEHMQDIRHLVGILRSWEDRFGAFLVRLGFDTLSLAVLRPPLARSEAFAITGEHLAVCPDLANGVSPFSSHARDIRDSQEWSFWWD